MFEIPKVIFEKHDSLKQLVDMYPDYIPIADLAKFLHAKPEGVKAWIESGNCPFAFSWQREVPTVNTRGIVVGKHTSPKTYKVPTYTFFMWYTQGIISKI